MAVQVVIRDGDPHWYLSPDIWVVPGDDPDGPAGSPVAGLPAYVWARVANTGDTGANGVRVDFYWANPALQVTRSNATQIGSANADIPPGGSQDVLCLVPWIPTIVNDGHECLVAVANHPGDPLPTPPPDAFDPPSYRQVAQKNLTVLEASMKARMFALTLPGSPRQDMQVVVTAELGGELDKETLAGLGLFDLRPAERGTVEVGLALEPGCVERSDPTGADKLEVRVPRGRSAAVHAAIRAERLTPGEYELVRVEERSGGDVLGGLAFVVVGADEDAGEGKEATAS